MSTMIISSQFGEYHRVERPLRRTAASMAGPNYAARRLGALFVAIVSVTVMVAAFNGVVSSFEAQPASAASANPAEIADAASAPAAVLTHVAAPGDSLWSIADEHRGDVNRDRFVDALVRLNGGTQIFVGQAVLLP